MTEDKQILAKIEPINRLLESRYGIRVELGSFEHLLSVRDLYDSKRQQFIATLGEAQALQTAEYNKAVLISEAVRLLLREIAPRRIKRKR